MAEVNGLKPCPFCGSEAKFISDTISIKCPKCGCAFIATNPLLTRMDVAGYWNKRAQQIPEGMDVVTVPAAEWQETVDYIRALHDCATCKHDQDATACKDVDSICFDCTSADCPCKNCTNGSAWEWRYDHGKD